MRVQALLLALACATASRAAAQPVASSTAAPAAPALAGLVVLGDPQLVVPVLSGVTGVQVKELPFLDTEEFKSRISLHLGQPLNRAGRDAIVDDIVLYFREHDRPMVNVTMPPQDIFAGVVQVLVVEGKVGEVRVQGNRWFSDETLAGRLRAKPGETLYAQKIDEDLDWINRNPFRQVDLSYARGSEVGKTDLVLRARDRFPLRLYAGYDDSGTPVTGNTRWLAGLGWGNVFGLDGQLNYGFSAYPKNINVFRAHTGSYVQPLPWRHILTVLGNYGDVRAKDLPDPFTMKGFNWQAGARYEVPLPRLEAYRHSLIAGFDFKRANNNLAFGGAKVYGTTTDILEWSLGYESNLRDRWGATNFRANVYYSPGAWTAGDTNADYEQSRAGATARYVYGRVGFDRTTGLPYDFSLFNAATLQISDSNLLASEQIGFGGYDSVRGYDSRVVNSDEGALVSAELRSPTVGLLRNLGLKSVPDQLQGLGFVDYGVAINKRRLPGEEYQKSLVGVGPGVRYGIGRYLSFRADYGWQLLKAETSRRLPARWHVGVIVSY
ncbi:MAG: hypothetical protein NTX64_14235 [Elusimicrobia bacterium]|nr:hypothetical protein [Elusimicrobiota bacterium]